MSGDTRSANSRAKQHYPLHLIHNNPGRATSPPAAKRRGSMCVCVCVCAHVTKLEVLSWKKQATPKDCVNWKHIQLRIMYKKNLVDLNGFPWKCIIIYSLKNPTASAPIFSPSLPPLALPVISKQIYGVHSDSWSRESSPVNSPSRRATLNLNQCVCCL